ncbi:acyl-CoA thioester hydrolase/BAAT C-terminal domain-containing protein [Corynebacterium sp. H128]|uniref:alpha/beta hydrolase family protein n=1 Tax=Corynebacterium sp. H128 TaxID=3133427 RepID=UPI0030B59D50
MRKLLKVLGALVLVVVLVVATIAGINAYNTKRYAVPGSTDLQDKSTYEINAQVKSIEGDYLNGFHFTPSERKHRGTVVVFGGSEGSPSYPLGKQLSEQGYEVLSLFFFGQPNQQADLAEVPLEFYDEVSAYLDTNITNPGPVTVIGASKGAELTANLAARGARMDNIVLYTPSEYTYQGLSFGREEHSSFTKDGQPVPYLSFRDAEPKASSKMFFDMMLGLPTAYRATYESMPERAANAEDARIPIANFQGKGLLFAGEQDAMWQGDVAARGLAERNPNLEAHVYPNAGHIFSEDITTFGRSWEKMLGGTVEGNRTAKQESDKVLLAKLAEWHG